MKTAALCVAAYDAAEFIPDLIRGITSQYPAPGWEIDIRIGVDACQKTANVLKKLKFPFFMAEKNAGHLILRNSLIYARPADIFLYFDADDYPFQSYIKINIQEIESGHNFVMPPKLNTDINLRPKTSKPVVENGGAMTFTHAVIDAVGGFPPYRCGGDTDLMRRAEMAGFTIHKMTGEALYYRRTHPKCLTKAPATRMGSAYRKQAWARMTADRKKGIIKIKPATVELTEVK